MEMSPEQVSAAKALVAALTTTIYSQGEKADEAAELLLLEDQISVITVLFGVLLSLMTMVCELTGEAPEEFVKRLGINVAEAEG